MIDDEQVKRTELEQNFEKSIADIQEKMKD